MKPTQFLAAEDGAVTVDWVVLTAAVVGLGMATYGVVAGGIQDLSGDVDTQMRQDLINTAWWTGPNIVERGMQRGYVVPGECDKSNVCTPDVMYLTTTYTMTNGETWYQSTTSENGEVVKESWADENGDTVNGIPTEATAEQIAAYEDSQQPFNIIMPPPVAIKQ